MRIDVSSLCNVVVEFVDTGHLIVPFEQRIVH